MFSKLLNPEIRPLLIRAAVSIVAVVAYTMYGKPLDEATIQDAVEMLSSFLAGSQLLPRAGDGK